MFPGFQNTSPLFLADVPDGSCSWLLSCRFCIWCQGILKKTIEIQETTPKQPTGYLVELQDFVDFGWVGCKGSDGFCRSGFHKKTRENTSSGLVSVKISWNDSPFLFNSILRVNLATFSCRLLPTKSVGTQIQTTENLQRTMSFPNCTVSNMSLCFCDTSSQVFPPKSLLKLQVKAPYCLYTLIAYSDARPLQMVYTAMF